MHARTVHVHVHLCMLGRAWEAMGGHGLVAFGLGITTGTGSGGHGSLYMHTSDRCKSKSTFSKALFQTNAKGDNTLFENCVI